MNVKAKLSIRAIVRWEQMTGRSFMHIDFSDNEDMIRLLYCATVIYMPEFFTFDQFALTLENKRILSASIHAVEAYNAYACQFARKQTEGDAQQIDTDTTISSVVAKLIMTGGLDAHFVMDEMLVEDLPMYLEALSDRIKQEEESRRLWTYYNILPHINGKKINSPSKIHVFPWEQAAAEQKARGEIKQNEAALQEFLAGNMINMDKITWVKRGNNEQ